jgi:hypothetical protein
MLLKQAGTVMFLVFLLSPLIVHGAEVSNGPVRQNMTMKADFRGESLQVVLGDICNRAGCDYAVDSSVLPKQLDRPVRMYAQHLSVLQVIRWAARIADLEVIRHKDHLLLTSPDVLGVTWDQSRIPSQVVDVGNAMQSTSAPVEQKKGIRRPPDASVSFSCLDRKADLEWLDAPLSRVSRDISRKYGIDFLIHPGVREFQPLVQLNGSRITLKQACQILGKQIKADIFLIDNVLWAVQSEDSQIKRKLFAWRTDTPEHGNRAYAGLQRRVLIEKTVRDWNVFADQFTRSIGMPCRLAGSRPGRFPEIRAEGSAREILEAARLCGLINWSMKGEPADGANIIYMQIRNKP